MSTIQSYLTRILWIHTGLIKAQNPEQEFDHPTTHLFILLHKLGMKGYHIQ